VVERVFAYEEKRMNLLRVCKKTVDRGVFKVMKVVIGPLAQSGLESRVGPNLPAAINTALVYYVGKLNSGRRPASFPKFLSMQGEASEASADGPRESTSPNLRPVVEVEVDERIEAAIYTDAERQGVSPIDLAGHAVLVYLAELDLVGDPQPADDRAAAAFAGPLSGGPRATH
jgi:hypothetical protein